MSIENQNRADNALFALHEYGEDTSLEATAIDLLTDLMHLSKREDWNFAELVRMAAIHFEAET